MQKTLKAKRELETNYIDRFEVEICSVINVRKHSM
jgi:hypothetical protein